MDNINHIVAEKVTELADKMINIVANEKLQGKFKGDYAAYIRIHAWLKDQAKQIENDKP